MVCLYIRGPSDGVKVSEMVLTACVAGLHIKRHLDCTRCSRIITWLLSTIGHIRIP